MGFGCPSAGDVFGAFFFQSAYRFNLHKSRCHVLFKDKVPDEKQNSFHLFDFAAESLSDLWLNSNKKND